MSPLEKLLSPWRNRRAHFVSPPGNNGDHLILLGSLEIFRRMGIELVDRPQDCDVIILNGGATMTESWRSGFGRLFRYSTRFPTKPLIVMPSSFDIRQTDFPALLRNHRSNTLLIARDRAGQKRLLGLPLSDRVTSEISDDAAFELQNSELIDMLKSDARNAYTLVVQRHDREGKRNANSSGYEKPPFVPTPPWRRPIHFAKHVIAPNIRGFLNSTRPELPKIVDDSTLPDCRETLQSLLPEYQPTATSGRIIGADISNPNLYSFEAFCTLIANAEEVISTRLHVGILSSLLGVKTVLIGQSYGKIEGIFEQTMSDWPHVQLMSSPANAKVTT